MARSWITPKTNWAKTDKVEYSDYNRIRNNLLYINDTLNEMYPDKAQTLDLGDAITYSANYLPSQFNAFEDALESFTRIGVNVNIGAKKTFSGNDPFITYNELNRIENCCLKWYNYDPVIHVSSISISPSSASIKIGETKTFTVTCLPANAEEVNDWIVTSSNTSVMTVIKSGTTVIATAVGVGTATINVSVYKSSASASLTVEHIYVEQIIPDNPILTIPKDADTNIGYALLPENATNKNLLTVTSSKTYIASVKGISLSAQTVKLTGKAVGQSILTFKCGQASAVATVEVINMAKSIWVANNRGDDKRINKLILGSDWIGKESPSQYVVTNPVDAVDKYEFTATVENAQIFDVIWKGRDEFVVKAKSVGLGYLNIALKSGAGIWQFEIEVRE